MKSFSIKLGAILIFSAIFILHGHVGAEWRRLGEFPKGEVEDAEKEGGVKKEIPWTNQPQKKDPSWRSLCETDSGKSFYDSENITYITKSISGAWVKTYLSQKYIRERLPKFCKGVQGVCSLEYLIQMNCADKRLRVLSADLYWKEEKKLISVPMNAEIDISQSADPDALIFEALHDKICR